MNERIKQLALLSGFDIDTNVSFAEKTRLNCFAELIVRECAETCKENLVNDAEAQAFGLTYNNAVGDCAIQIKQHFGVEE